jgi:hypothetical protein
MARSGLPRPASTTLSKVDLLRSLAKLDASASASRRALKMETDFRTRIERHHASLPSDDAEFDKFNTSPFVVMFYALQHGLERISEIEEAILPAKVFSSMETSAGRMAEAVALPVYGWEFAPSEMHSAYSAIDGKKMDGDTVCLASLKSGPRCLNDEMSENFADNILTHCEQWASDAGVKKIDFTYGVLYGTRRKSNKKDWHILRNIAEKAPRLMREEPANQWHCRFVKKGIDVTVTIRIGLDWWAYAAGNPSGFMELAVALLRSCIKPADGKDRKAAYTISDLADIVSLSDIPTAFNVKILQRSQLEWLFFFARHFCDQLELGDTSLLKTV